MAGVGSSTNHWELVGVSVLEMGYGERRASRNEESLDRK